MSGQTVLLVEDNADIRIMETPVVALTRAFRHGSVAPSDA